MSYIPTGVKILLICAIAVLGINFTILLSQVWDVDENVKTANGRTEEESKNCYSKKRPPVVWVYARKELAMSHVYTVFDRLEYKVSLPGEPWDVMWSHSYPYNDFQEDLQHLQPHQRINHFPGTGCFVSKPRLSTHGFPFTPKTFKLPSESGKLLREAKSRPDDMWVQKSNKHRGVRIVKLEEFDLNSEGSIVQQFINNPMLIDGRAFDVGIYTVITSINPLRVYVYGEEILWRFCGKDYLPFNPKNLQSYVVDDDYTPAWDLPSLRPLIKDKGLSHREVFNIVLKQKGFSPEAFWDKAHSIIQKVLYHCESNVANYSRSYSSTRNFFELVRFDFIIDENMNVWLMEVNLSPNLSSSHTLDNRFMYEQIIYNVLKIAGLARGLDPSFNYNGHYESIMLVNEHDIQVPLTICTDDTCTKDCNHHLNCQLCKQCRSEDLTFTLKTAFLEHANRRNFNRFIPPPTTGCHGDHLPSGPIGSHPSTRANNHLMEVWFNEKCCQQQQWCF